MRIFLTGATGYIGNRLAIRLVAEGNIVHALCRPSARTALLKNDLFRIFEGDITDPPSVRRAMEGCGQAYHLAAYARTWARDPTRYERINVEGTKNVLDAAQELRMGRIVFTSTAGVLGPSAGRPVKEDDPRIGEPLNEYEETKTRAEALCRERVVRDGLSVVIVNPPRVYGPGVETGSNAVTWMADRYLRGRWRILPGNGRGIGSYVHVEDVVNGHLLAMERGRSGERYILSGANASYREFFDTLARVSGKRFRMVPVPIWLLAGVGGCVTGARRLTGRPPLITAKWIRKFARDWALSSEKARRELGYSFRPLEDGLRQTVDWLRRRADER